MNCVKLSRQKLIFWRPTNHTEDVNCMSSHNICFTNGLTGAYCFFIRYVECQNEMFSGPTLAANLIDISFLKAIKALAADKVANVRIGVARLLLLVVGESLRYERARM